MKLISILVFISIPLAIFSNENKVNWLTFEQLEDSLATNPKKVYIDFYTDWCSYCKKMDKEVYTKKEVIENLKEYYAVKFDAQSEELITFGGQDFVNDQVEKSRTPVHQIAQILATRDDNFVPPAVVILDENFVISDRYFEYLDSKTLINIISE